MKYVFIINPNSGRNEKYNLMNEIKEHFQGKRIIIEKTKRPGHATFIAQKYAMKTQEPVHIFVCGGDGTIHEVVNGVVGCDHIQLSIIPIGTGNDFIKAFEGLKKQDFLNLKNYADPVSMDCDLLKVNGEYAINTISFGFDVNVANYVNKFRKKIAVGGIVPYYMGMLTSLSKPLSYEYDIQIDSNKLPVDTYSFVVFGNGRYYGGGYKPCPDAFINDGLIDVCLIGNVKRREILKFSKEYEKGNLGKLMPERVLLSQAKTIHLNTHNEDVIACLDGEIRTIKNPTIEIVPSAVHLLLPKQQ